MNRSVPGLLTLAASAPFLAHVAHAQAPLARLTQIQQKVEVSAGKSAFRALSAGAAINRGDVVRTGRRSKADIKFGDGSLVRLGQLSSLEVRGPRQVEVKGGQALISWLSPGKIGTSYAAAEIKGTIVNVRVTDEGATFTLYEGATDVVTAKGRQTLKPGTAVTAQPDGTLSGLRAAAPIFFAEDGAQLDLKDAPKSGAFVGSDADVAVKNSSARVAQREVANQSQRTEIPVAPGLPPISVPTGTNTGGDQPADGVAPGGDSNPPANGEGGTTGGNPPAGNGNSSNGNNADGNGDSTTPPASGDGTAAGTTPAPSTPTGDGKKPTKKLSDGNADRTANTSVLERLAKLDGPPALPRFPQGRDDPARLVWAQIPFTLGARDNTDALKTDQVAGATATPGGFDSRRAQQRIDELSGQGGRASGFDARAIGVLGDGGTYAYGARIRGFLARGNYLLDGAVQPLKVRAGNQTFDLSAVSDLSLTYRSPQLEVQAGRQRFLSGPTQATLYGSLVRQGGREIMDAIRVAKPLGAARLEAAYLVDAYPRNLPFRVGGLQRGFYARYSQQKKANLGLNLIKYFNLGNSSKLGASLDFAVPLSKSGVDFYGEGGIDTFGRGLGSLGLSLPGFYARTGFDVYLEAAYVGSSNQAPRPPAEFALRAYRRLSDNLDLVGSVSHFSNGNTSALIGISVGSRHRKG